MPSDIDPEHIAEMLGSESEEVDMEALASAVDDLSIDPIEDEVDIAVINKHQ